MAILRIVFQPSSHAVGIQEEIVFLSLPTMWRLQFVLFIEVFLRFFLVLLVHTWDLQVSIQYTSFIKDRLPEIQAALELSVVLAT